jgi:hypothetical protein
MGTMKVPGFGAPVPAQAVAAMSTTMAAMTGRTFFISMFPYFTYFAEAYL